MKRLGVLVVLVVLSLTAGRKYPDGWQYIPLPPEDEFATNRFGRSWLEPVYNGYLIVSNRYIEAPYVVEQRGFVIFVNNERVEDGTDIRLVSPTPPEQPITEDPGYPTNLTRDSTMLDVLLHPTVLHMNEYLNYRQVYNEERLETQLSYYKQLPCISNMVNTGETTMGCPVFWFFDYQGNSNLVTIQTQPRQRKRTATDPELYGHIIGALGSDRRALEGNSVIQVLNGGFRGPAGRMWDTNRWMDVFRALTHNLTPSQRVARIHAAEALGRVSDHHIMTLLPMDGLIATPQLWQRLSGDMSWTNDASARLLALTNGWRKIDPAWLRTQTVATAKAPEHDLALSAVAAADSDTGNKSARKPSDQSRDRPLSNAGTDSTNGNMTLLVLIGAMGVVLVVLLLIWRRMLKHPPR